MNEFTMKYTCHEHGHLMNLLDKKQSPMRDMMCGRPTEHEKLAKV